MELPPDRSHVPSEQSNQRSAGLHRLTVAECVRLIHEEDRAAFTAIDRAQSDLAAFVLQAEPGFTAGGRLVYLGAGTSGRLGVLDAAELPPTFQVAATRVVGIIAGGEPALSRSSESREDDVRGACRELSALELGPRDAVVGITASGTTPYVLGGLEHAKRMASPPLTALMVCAAVNKPACVDHLIVLATGPEVITGSTRMKAGTATKMALNIISTTLMVRSGRVYRNLMVDVRATNTKLVDRAVRIITTLTELSRAAAFELLERAGMEVKTALVMHRRQLHADAARAVLAAHGGRLDALLE
ncbi:MAG: N-acetylmuramic acid 6-phosphate etherase [Planctomycetota bacterium]